MMPVLPNNAAVIVEPRKHAALRFVVSNFRKHLKIENWPIYMIHGTKNSEYAKEQLKNIENITFINCGKGNFQIEDYSAYLTSEAFWNLFPRQIENILIFQTDTLLFGPDIDPFLKYDYVGAPWKWNKKSGNGGLSLRKKSSMIEAIQHNDKQLHQKKIKRHPEDVFYAKYLYNHIHNKNNGKESYKLPSFAVAKRFSVESSFHKNPLGIHKCWRHMKGKRWKTLTKKHPEIKKLKALQYSVDAKKIPENEKKVLSSKGISKKKGKKEDNKKKMLKKLLQKSKKIKKKNAAITKKKK